MTSQDVIHSFYVPAFRMKQDVLPGRYTTAWFRATKPGTYHLFCTAILRHPALRHDRHIVVMEPAQYAAWMNRRRVRPLAATGAKIFAATRLRHLPPGRTQGRGPNLIGVFGSPVQLEDGRIVMADENYIRESILDPGRKS